MLSPSIREICGANLLSRYWAVRDAERLNVHDSWFARCESRFRGTFTKLRAIEMIMFRKVIVMDLDMAVLSHTTTDLLFGMESQSAVFWGNTNIDVGPHRSFVDIEPVDGKQR